jgi:hypothetical protein
MDIQPLPLRAGLEQYRKQAKALIKAFKSGDPDAIRSIRQHHPRLLGRANTNDRNRVSVSEIRSTGVTLADAQCVVARWHGFQSWPKLTKHIEALNRKNSRVPIPFGTIVAPVVQVGKEESATSRKLVREDGRRSGKERRSV